MLVPNIFCKLLSLYFYYSTAFTFVNTFFKNFFKYFCFYRTYGKNSKKTSIFRNIEEVLTGHTLKGSIIEGSQFISTPVEVTNDDGNKETKSLFEVTKEGQVYIRAEAIINKLKVSQLETDSIVLSGKAYGLGSLDDIGSNEDAENAFRVNNSTGLLEARNALIRGTIYANTGEIAGLVLETQSLSNETSKVIRTKDSQNNAAFEIRVSNAGSSISILTLNCKDGNFVNSIYTKTLYAGAIQLANTSLYVSNKRVMSFEYTQEGETVAYSYIFAQKPLILGLFLCYNMSE